MDDLLKAGAFADLCCTTKETLRHYDRMGLLQPTARAENGYKLYSLAQTADFALVSALQGAGLSLAEIRGFLKEPGSDHLLEVLVERIAAIEQQQKALERKQRVLENALAQASNLRSWLEGETHEAAESGRKGAPLAVPETAGSGNAVVDVRTLIDDGLVHAAPDGHRWRIRTCPEERFVETAMPYAEDAEGSFLAAARDHLAYCERNGLGGTFQEAYRIEAEHAARGSYAEGYCAETRALATVGPERLRIKPAGAYLQWLNRIDIATYLEDEAGESPSQPVENPMFAAYDAMRAFAAERRWRLVGDLYDTVLSPYSGNIEEAIYTEVSMRLDL